MALDRSTNLTENPPIKDASTVIVLRDKASVLMGQRGQKAAFMPGKFVFPGGAVDPQDDTITLAPLQSDCEKRLQSESVRASNALKAAAIRELWEETGQILGTRTEWRDPPQGWEDFAALGVKPDASAMTFFFRAVTPEGRPRRFDARFFLVNADALVSDLDDFSTAEDELAHLQWVPLDQARHFDLPFITKVVLAELNAHILRDGPVTNVPFFRNDDEAHLISQLGGTDLI